MLFAGYGKNEYSKLRLSNKSFDDVVGGLLGFSIFSSSLYFYCCNSANFSKAAKFGKNLDNDKTSWERFVGPLWDCVPFWDCE